MQVHIRQRGHDADGKEYESASQLWSEHVEKGSLPEEWYQKAVSYWDQQEASVNGVLGGFGYVSDIDIRDSTQLLLKIMKDAFTEAASGSRTLVALDCGAGVGRVSKDLLLRYFQVVDLVEPSQHLLSQAETDLKSPKAKLPKGHCVGNLFCCGLQDFQFTESHRYDCIWIQWCLLYLTDDDVVRFFQRCGQGLKSDGYIVVKENICKEGFVVDKEDSSLTRSNQYMLELCEKAGMRVLYNVSQKSFPKELFQVRMYVLKPEASP